VRVIIREAAYGDLERIYAWIEKERPRSADAVLSRILESVDRLGHFPHMGHLGKTSATYEWVVPGLPYILVYEVHPADDLVAVAAVFHGAQDRKNRE
jgi:toxin ParE1/3/4